MKKKTETATRLGVGRKMPVSPLTLTIAVSLLLTLIVEVLSRRSLTGLFRFIWGNPLAFLLSWSIVMLTVSIAMMFRKKAFSAILVSVIWLVLGIVNNQLLGRRTGNPLAAGDLFINADAILMMPIYYTWLQIGLYTLAGAAAVAVLVLLFIKTPVYRRDLKSAFLRLVSSGLIASVLLLICLEGGYVSRDLKPSLYDSYLAYGFPYGFMYGFFDTGIRKPDEYSPETVKQVANDIDIDVSAEPTPVPPTDNFVETFNEYLRTGEFSQTPETYTAESVATISDLLGANTTLSENRPNFIFVQLESFCDPSVFTNYSLDESPVPYYRQLLETCPSGRLYVPTVSGGTANTEFEVLTGCNLDFFGTGEFPFYSVLRENVCESLATDLRLLGYTSTLMHNYTGSFYYRNQVYSNLDFDAFLSVEYMNGYDTTPKGWCKDNVFEKYFLEAMNASEGPDFIYAVTVQTHGAYTELPEGTAVEYDCVTELDETAKSAFDYYCTQLHAVDEFLRQLTLTLSEFDEPVVLVLYGDHLPGLSFGVEDIADGNMYATDYAIWTNFETANAKRNLEAYQLGAYTLGLFELDPGVIVKFHQTQMDKPDYLTNLKILEYDIMYGSHYVYGGATLARTDVMRFGITPITVDSARVSDGHLFVYGSNFTKASRIMVDDSTADTIFVSESLLIAPDTAPNDDAAVSVAQIAADRTVLSKTPEVAIK